MGALRGAAIGLAVAGLTLLGPPVVRADIPELVATLTDAHVGDAYPPRPTGEGFVRIFLGSDPGIICFELTLSNMPNWAAFGNNQFDAWIGKGLPGVAGPSVADFPPIVELPLPETITTGCISGLSQSLISDLFTHPEQYYVEVLQLNPDVIGCGVDFIPCFPGGIRGQLGFAPGHVTSSAPPQIPNAAMAAGTTTASPAAALVAPLGTLLILAAFVLTNRSRPIWRPRRKR